MQAERERAEAAQRQRAAEERERQRVAELQRQLAAAIAEAQLLRESAADAERGRVEAVAALAVR